MIGDFFFKQAQLSQARVLFFLPGTAIQMNDSSVIISNSTIIASQCIQAYGDSALTLTLINSMLNNTVTSNQEAVEIHSGEGQGLVNLTLHTLRCRRFKQ